MRLEFELSHVTRTLLLALMGLMTELATSRTYTQP